MVENGRKNCNVKIEQDFIRRFVLRGRNFVDYSCFPYGKYTESVSGEVNVAYRDDFQYFVFTKSIKSLISIRQLLKIGNIEDVWVLLRTAYEGYLAARYLGEKCSSKDDLQLIWDFLFTPYNIGVQKVKICNGTRQVQDKITGETFMYTERGVKQLVLGEDKKYHNSFYAFLCNFTHNNYSIMPYYQSENGVMYTYERCENKWLAEIMVLFVYEKMFETVVTVEGEDFKNEREQRECYRLVKDTLVHLDESLEALENYNSQEASEELNSYMKKMFKYMRESLREELGSIKKE